MQIEEDMNQIGKHSTRKIEVRGRGIRVLALIPGAVDTEIWQQFWPEAPRERMVSPKVVAQAVLHAITVPEGSTVSELVIGPVEGTL